MFLRGAGQGPPIYFILRSHLRSGRTLLKIISLPVDEILFYSLFLASLPLLSSATSRRRAHLIFPDEQRRETRLENSCIAEMARTLREI